MTLNDEQNHMNSSTGRDFSDLSALFLNCTRKRSPARPHTEGPSLSPRGKDPRA